MLEPEPLFDQLPVRLAILPLIDAPRQEEAALNVVGSAAFRWPEPQVALASAIVGADVFGSARHAARDEQAVEAVVEAFAEGVVGAHELQPGAGAGGL